MAQNIVRLDEGEEEESEVTQEARQEYEEGGMNRKRHEDRRLMKARTKAAKIHFCRGVRSAAMRECEP